MSTPLANLFHLSTSQCTKTIEEAEDMSKVSYASAIRCLMYAMVCTRLDLAQCGEQVYGKSGEIALYVVK